MSNQNYKILLVDDEAEIRAILEELLKPLEVETFHASNGREALEHLEKEEVSAVFSDISMPRMTGLQFLEALKRKSNEVPVIMLTAFGDKENVKEALRLGAVDFLEKPFQSEEVVRVAKRILEVGASKRQLARLHAKAANSEDDNVVRLFDIQHEKRKIGVLSVKNNKDAKRKSKSR